MFLITLFVAVLTACSDNNDEPKPPQDPPSDSENLYSMKELLSNDFLMGDRILYGVNMYINFTGNNNRELLMDDAWFEKKFKNSDWYFEYNGKQYRYGEVMDVPGNSTPIDMKGYRLINRYMIAPVDIPWENLKAGPITYSYKFVWPSKNINHTIKVYAVYNKNYESERAEILKNLSKDSTAFVEMYKIGYWIDGKPMESLWKDLGLYTIPIEE